LCDRDTLELLQYLLNLALARPDILAGRKLFLLGTLRVEEENSNIQLKELLSTLRGGEQFTEIQLAPLDETETKLLAAYISERELTSEEARNLHRETEGNPLFIVETIRAGISDRLPPKVQAVIKARLGQVSSLARELVDLAAVIGREFSFQMIAKASDQEEEDLVKGLDELWQRHILREQGSDGYDFSHDKIREVVYTSLSSARRRWFHRRVGNALEAVHQGALELVSGQIGNHFELAGMPGEAISYYRQAAETARNIYANREAVNFLRRCLVIIQSGDPSSVSSQETVVEIDESLGEILALVGEYSEAREVFHLALPYVNESDLIKKASLQTKIGNTFREQGTFEQAIHHYQTAESILAKAPENENPQWWQEWVQVKLERMLTHYWLGQPDSMQNLLEETRPAVEQYGTEIQQANFYLTHHRMELHRERYRLSDQTVALQRMATRQIEAVGSTSEIAAHRFTLGFSLLWSGHLVDAEETLQSALKLAEKTGNRQLQTRCLNYLTTLYRMLGRNELVQEYAERNLAAAIETCLPEYAFSARANQSWLALKEGKIQEAETLAQDALTRLTQSKVKYVFNWLALFPLIDIRLKIHRIDQAIEFAREIVSPEQQRLPEELSAALEQSVADWEGDDPESAVEQLHGAVKLAEQFGYL
jgi:tetratricopeptide (TPR) repeat protein